MSIRHFGCRNLVYVSNKQNTPLEKHVPHGTVNNLKPANGTLKIAKSETEHILNP